ncbi:hypothetical protein FPQ18DRAFT_380525 [Pyronema domesticum]|nr:hypothetical protein FPQ18DRAFT_380525 [Pyronema domesticum]
MCKFLLENGADPDCISYENGHRRHILLRDGLSDAESNRQDLKEILKGRALLLDYGADPSHGLTTGIGWAPVLQPLQDVFNKASMFIGRDDVSDMLLEMIEMGGWDHPTYNNRCIKEVLKHGPRLDTKNGHERTLLHIPFTWDEERHRSFSSPNSDPNWRTILHLGEILYDLIPTGEDVRATDFHGETITETEKRRGVCGVWEKALKKFGYDAKSIISADLRVGLIYCNIDGTLITVMKAITMKRSGNWMMHGHNGIAGLAKDIIVHFNDYSTDEEYKAEDSDDEDEEDEKRGGRKRGDLK